MEPDNAPPTEGEDHFALRQADVLNCMFSNWYPQFQRHSFASTVIPLPQTFVDYLLADGVLLPPSCAAETHSEFNPLNQPEDDADLRTGDVDWNAVENEAQDAEGPSFPELESTIRSVIAEYGGVYPKLNWSAPRDASWAIPSTILRCTRLADVLTLLKSSDFIVHDLCHAFDDCVDQEGRTRPDLFTLVLRKHLAELHHCNEFRCFVRDRQLIAISQRHSGAFFEFLPEEKARHCDCIAAFWAQHIRDVFSNNHYVFDVYLNKSGRVFIVDFNVWGPSTDSLLFTWDELQSSAPLRERAQEVDTDADTKTHTDTDTPETDTPDTNDRPAPLALPHAHASTPPPAPVPVIRVVEGPQGVQPEYAMESRVPLEIVGISLGEGLGAFIERCKEQQREEVSET
eukprot:gnl/Trimastix_PCT/3487.p1 GENE.gnl/Trimastix_PCT/3487~~gnl/Trimastix_PCT/3487.p1  ORF type:complete len:400 (-),score=107.97 gnl/Trimastix_PCT/3487:299-1498(-)